MLTIRTKTICPTTAGHRPRFTRRHVASVLFVWLALTGLAAGQTNAPVDSPLVLWYGQPAQKWTDALPIGNGRLGAMIFGGITDERIQFNEDTLWTGHPHDYANTNGPQVLPAIRQMLAAGANKGWLRRRLERSSQSELILFLRP